MRAPARGARAAARAGGEEGWPLESLVEQVGDFFKGKPEEAPVGSTVAPFTLDSTSGSAVQVPAAGISSSVVFFFNKVRLPPPTHTHLFASRSTSAERTQPSAAG